MWWAYENKHTQISKVVNLVIFRLHHRAKAETHNVQQSANRPSHWWLFSFKWNIPQYAVKRLTFPLCYSVLHVCKPWADSHSTFILVHCFPCYWMSMLENTEHCTGKVGCTNARGCKPWGLHMQYFSMTLPLSLHTDFDRQQPKQINDASTAYKSTHIPLMLLSFTYMPNQTSIQAVFFKTLWLKFIPGFAVVGQHSVI